MSHFAQIDENNIVTNVIVAEQDFIDSGAVGDPSKWIQTSYNTQAGEHKLGGTPLRGNFAGVGYTYDKEHDVFYEPKPFDSWTLNTETWLCEAPTPKPSGAYKWNETNIDIILEDFESDEIVKEKIKEKPHIVFKSHPYLESKFKMQKKSSFNVPKKVLKS